MSTRSGWVWASLALVGVAIVPVLGQEVTYDVLITGGRIADGTGNPWFSGDVGIKEGIPHVLVKGVLVIDNGRHTGVRPGKPIYGKGHRRAS